MLPFYLLLVNYCGVTTVSFVLRILFKKSFLSPHEKFLQFCIKFLRGHETPKHVGHKSREALEYTRAQGIPGARARGGRGTSDTRTHRT